MRGKSVLTVIVCLLVSVSFVAQAADAKKAKPAAKATAVPAADLKWADMPDVPGVKMADAYGDHTKGAYGMFVKFPAGFATPVHTHTSEMRSVVLSGTIIHTPDGKPEVRLGPGSFLRQPGAGYKHVTACDKASECMIYTESNGKFDLIPAEAAKK